MTEPSLNKKMELGNPRFKGFSGLYCAGNKNKPPAMRVVGEILGSLCGRKEFIEAEKWCLK